MCLNDVRRFSRNEKLSALNLTKLIGLLSSTLPAQIKFRYLQKKKTNTSFSEKWILQWPCNTGEFSQLFWRMENFVGRKIQQREPPMTIQADVLTEG